MITIIVPAFNEELRITPTIDAILAALRRKTKDFEILVVNDGSTDNTKAVVESLENEQIKLLSYETNRGKGGAVKFGVEHARGDYIVFTDADLPYPPNNIHLACEKLASGTAVVLGKREMKENGGQYPWYRRVMSNGFGLLVKAVLHIKTKDTQCGFKAFRKEAAQDIFSRVTLSGWGFDMEVIFLAENLGYTTERLTVELFHDKKNSKINPVRDAIAMTKEVFKVKKNFKQGKYGL